MILRPGHSSKFHLTMGLTSVYNSPRLFSKELLKVPRRYTEHNMIERGWKVAAVGFALPLFGGAKVT